MRDAYVEQAARLRTASKVRAPERAIPPMEVPAWAWALAAGAVLLVYLVGFDNGAILGNLAPYAHEFFHNTRHFAAFPCH